MTETDEAGWPPPGHSMVYNMEMDLTEPKLKYEAEVTIIGGEQPNDIAAFRWERLGGANDQDREFRSELYQAIGEVTVAGGHAETAMKRVLVVAEGKKTIADVEDSWGNLETRLRKIAKSDHEYAASLSEIMAWAESSGVKKRRDDVIHASWVNFFGVSVQRSRFTLKGDSHTRYGSIEELVNDARVIFKFARRLDDLIVSDWPQARLPKTEPDESPSSRAQSHTDEAPSPTPKFQVPRS